MRTTITLADDVYAEVERLRRDQGLGPSEAVNMLARRGLALDAPQPTYTHRAAPIGLRLDVTNVAEALELLDDDE